MSYHSKRRIVNTVVYMVLSLIVVSVLCVTVITFVSANRKQKPPLPDDAPSDGASSEKQPADLPLDADKPSKDLSSGEKPSEQPSEVPDTPADDKDSSSGKIPANTEPELHFTLPLKGYVQKDFSIKLPVWSATMEDYRAHKGIDVSASIGDAVCAITAGVITEVREDALTGVTVSIEHAEGFTSVYSNLAKELASGVAAGAAVGEGQVIGAVGDTALGETAETEHLHFELRKNGVLVNPTEYLDYSAFPPEDSGNE